MKLIKDWIPLGAIALVGWIWWQGQQANSRPDYESNSPRTVPAAVTGHPPQSETWQVVPGSIYDGDTLRVKNGFGEIKVRFCGIDAPEKDQPLGIQARDYLRSLINKGDGSIIVVPIEQDRYGRTVAELFISPRSGTGYQAGEEIHLNSQMVLAGYAYHYTRYSGNCPNRDAIVTAENIAKQKRAGVWADPNAIAPWEWRKRNK
jgi:endonuclease YncB( thermonuclease family)